MSIYFSTDRLIGRAFDPETDAEAALTIYGDPEVTKWIGGETFSDVASMKERLEMGRARWAKHGEPHCLAGAFLRDGDVLVGAGLLKPLPDPNDEWTEDIEVGWHLARAHWGNGYATEIGRALIERGFALLEVDRLHAVVDPGNLRSERVAERCGMTRVGTTDAYYGKTLTHFVIERARETTPPSP